MAQSTIKSCQTSQFTLPLFLGRLSLLSSLPVFVHILLLETDKCLPESAEGREWPQKIFHDQFYERMLPHLGIEPTTSWSPVGRSSGASNWFGRSSGASDWSTKAGYLGNVMYAQYHQINVSIIKLFSMNKWQVESICSACATWSVQLNMIQTR